MIRTGLEQRPVPGLHWVLSRHLFRRNQGWGPQPLGTFSSVPGAPAPGWLCMSVGGLYPAGDDTGLPVPILSQGIQGTQVRAGAEVTRGIQEQ